MLQLHVVQYHVDLLPTYRYVVITCVYLLAGKHGTPCTTNHLMQQHSQHTVFIVFLRGLLALD